MNRFPVYSTDGMGLHGKWLSALGTGDHHLRQSMQWHQVSTITMWPVSVLELYMQYVS